jgi:hypothetical protein
MKAGRDYGSDYCRIRSFNGEREERFRAFRCFRYGDGAVGIVQGMAGKEASTLFSKRQWRMLLAFLARCDKRRPKARKP